MKNRLFKRSAKPLHWAAWCVIALAVIALAVIAIPPVAPSQVRAIDAQESTGADRPADDLARAKQTKAQLESELKAAIQRFGDTKPSVEIAEIRENLGLALKDLGEWQRAEREIAAALRARIALHGDVHPQTAQTRGMLALVLADPARPDARMGEAIVHYAEAVEVFERTLGLTHEVTREHLWTTALRCCAAGRPDLGMAHAQRLLKALRLTFADQPQQWLPALDLLAQAAKDSGNFPVAVDACTQIHDIHHSRKNEQGVAAALLSRGQVHAHAQHFETAIVDFKEALTRFEGIPGTKDDQLSCLIPMASCYRELGNIDEAESRVEAAERILGDKPQRSILALILQIERGRVFRSRNNPKKARSAFQAAVAAAPADVMSVTGPLLAEAHRLWARAELDLGEPAAAIRQLEAARDLCITWRGARHAATADMQLSLGLVQLQLSDPESARRSLAEAVAGFAAGADSLRLLAESEAIRRLDRINLARDALLSAMRPAKDAPDSELYGHVWLTKGLLTRHSMGRFARAAQESRLDKELDSLRQVKVEISNLLWSSTSPRPNAEEVRQGLVGLSARKKLLESQLAFRPATEDDTKAKPSHEELARLLPANVAVVDFIFTSHFEPNSDGTELNRDKIFYEAYVLRSRDEGRRLEVSRIELGTARALNAYLLRWREAISLQRNFTKPITRKENLPPDADAVEVLAAMSDDRAYNELGKSLRKAIWDPIDRHLEGIETVVILPDVDFDRIPWYALPGKQPGADLIDDYAICTVLNGEHLVTLLRRRAETPASPKPGAASAPIRPEGCLFVSDLSYGGRWKPLHASGEEVRKTMALQSVPRPSSWLHGEDGRPEKVVEEMVRRRYVHFSTHAKFATNFTTEQFVAAFMPASLEKRNENPPFDPDALFQNKLKKLAAQRTGKTPRGAAPDVAAALILEESPLSCAALVLSKAASKGTAWQRADVLSGEVIASLDLRGADLVVLSACETNRGPALLGEGTLSLQRAFLLAGTRSVVGSLWNVEEQATAKLMELFYVNLWERQLTKIEALRTAQRTMRDSYGTLEGAEPQTPVIRTPPRFWAQFMLSGDWDR